MIYGAMNSPIRPILEELRKINELGFDYLELTMDAPQADYMKILEQKEGLMRGLDEFQMGLICHLPTFVSIADLTGNIRDASLGVMLESLDAAAELRPLKVVFHPGYITGLGVLVMEQSRQYAMESLGAIVEKADTLGLFLCIENLFPRSNSLINPEDFVDVFEKFPTLKMTLDTGHAHLGDKGGKKVLQFIDRFPDRIFHVHASDNFGIEDSHLPIGTGTIDFPEIIKALKRAGYDHTVTFEVFSKDRDYLQISRKKFNAMVETS